MARNLAGDMDTGYIGVLTLRLEMPWVSNLKDDLVDEPVNGPQRGLIG